MIKNPDTFERIFDKHNFKFRHGEYGEILLSSRTIVYMMQEYAELYCEKFREEIIKNWMSDLEGNQIISDHVLNELPLPNHMEL